jgi:hypothetical protein
MKARLKRCPKGASVNLTKFIRVIWMNDLKRRSANECKINHKSESCATTHPQYVIARSRRVFWLTDGSLIPVIRYGMLRTCQTPLVGKRRRLRGNSTVRRLFADSHTGRLIGSA